MVRVQVAVDTDLVQDQLTIQLKEPPRLETLLAEVTSRYHLWHAFTIHEFELQKISGEPVDEKIFDKDLSKASQLLLKAIETDDSRKKREAQRLAEEEKKRKREEEARIKEEARLAKIAELSKIGKCWSLEQNSPYIDVPLELDGLTAKNKGSMDQWCTVQTLHPVPARGQYFTAIEVVRLPETTNTWKICFGVVPIGFKINADRRWVGSQKSWAYVSGTGGKCHDSGKSADYGAEWGEGDIIGVFLDFDAGTIEFFKNGASQGVAFNNLVGPVHPAVSLTAKDSEVRIVDEMPAQMIPIMQKFYATENQLKLRWANMTSPEVQLHLVKQLQASNSTAWDAAFSASKDHAIYYPDDNLIRAVNEGSGDKWRTCRALVCYSSGIKFIEIKIENDAKTTNSWRFCVGAVPVAFSCTHARAWVGAQDSWAYISGTGGKANNSGQSAPYGDQFGQKDVIGILLNFPSQTIEFFKNGVSQGIAFRNLNGPVYPAVSMTATGSCVSIREAEPELVQRYIIESQEREMTLQKVIQNYANVWDCSKLSADLVLDNQCLRVKNVGSKDKWRACGGLLPYSTGRRYFEVVIEECPSTTNSWKICVGVIPKTYDFNHQKLWIGAQASWGYIAGTGGKGFDSGRTTSYGAKYGKGDRIGVLMDFDNLTLEFFKNGSSQGIAFTQLTGPVYPAVSLTAKNSSVLIDASAELIQSNIERLFLYR